ncbi:NAD-dependent epimerase/dehydratase family protein [Shewanella baltica]|uniref:NAD-dependent epimerase/dehydratase family protein n=1 Tax=Shewanella baltica TaxID=62322 RepID=UPI00217E9252|nr:NAD-dependent epimerase/dehydratase family protein [Shewanella baltica]MCS6175143.1 NAD-dependent epimerase/dehydratase family protein [Shewanella baltica]
MILLTGSNGYIGNHLINYKTANGLSIKFRNVIRSSNPSTCNTYVIKRLDGVTNWNDAFNNINCVIHLAGLAHVKGSHESNFKNVNTDGTLHLANEAAKAGVKRFVFVSSIGVNGTFTEQLPFSNTADVNPHNAYAQSKYDAEVGLKKIASETGLEVVIVRPTLVYGANAPGNFGMLTKLIIKLPILPFGLVDNRRDFIAVQNLADLLITCATHPNPAGHTFLASDMDTVSIKQFTNAIADGLGKKVFQLPIPVSLMRLAGKLMGKSAMVEQLVGNLQVDSSNIKDVLGWTPPLTMKQAMASLSDSGKSSLGKE